MQQIQLNIDNNYFLSTYKYVNWILSAYIVPVVLITWNTIVSDELIPTVTIVDGTFENTAIINFEVELIFVAQFPLISVEPLYVPILYGNKSLLLLILIIVVYSIYRVYH